MTKDEVIQYIKQNTHLLDESQGEYISNCVEIKKGVWNITFEDLMTIRFYIPEDDKPAFYCLV